MRKLSMLLLAPILLVADECCISSYLTVGGSYSRLNLKPEGERSFNGNLWGAQAKYEYRPIDAFYGALEFRWREGKADSRHILEFDTAEKLGYTWGCCDWETTFYTGFGFRFLRQHVHASKKSTFNGSFFPPFLSNSHSVKLDYYEFYIPVGFATDYSFNSCFALGINFEWMPQVFPTVQIHPLGGTYWSLKRKIENFLVEMPFSFTLDDCCTWFLVLSPFYERWQDGHSTAKTSRGTPLGLPENTYNYYGVDLNLVFAF